MSEIQWDSQAGLMRVIDIATSGESMEELVARGTVRELVDAVLAMSPLAQKGLLLRAATADVTLELDSDAIRELAARPGFTGARGDDDTADRPDGDADDEVEA